jgi:hypothetical protein
MPALLTSDVDRADFLLDLFDHGLAGVVVRHVAFGSLHVETFSLASWPATLPSAGNPDRQLATTV